MMLYQCYVCIYLLCNQKRHLDPYNTGPLNHQTCLRIIKTVGVQYARQLEQSPSIHHSQSQAYTLKHSSAGSSLLSAFANTAGCVMFAFCERGKGTDSPSFPKLYKSCYLEILYGRFSARVSTETLFQNNPLF